MSAFAGEDEVGVFCGIVFAQVVHQGGKAQPDGDPLHRGDIEHVRQTALAYLENLSFDLFSH